MSQQKNQNASMKNREEKRTHQPLTVQNDAPGYGDKKLEGPNRPAT